MPNAPTFTGNMNAKIRDSENDGNAYMKLFPIMIESTVILLFFSKAEISKCVDSKVMFREISYGKYSNAAANKGCFNKSVSF